MTTRKKHRRNVTMDDEAERIAETHNINVSKFLRTRLKQEYGAVSMMEKKREELQRELDDLFKRKQEIEKQMHETEREKDRLDNLLTENRVMQKIQDDPGQQKAFEEHVQVLRRTEMEDGREQTLQFLSVRAEMFAEEHGYDEGEVERLFRESVLG